MRKNLICLICAVLALSLSACDRQPPIGSTAAESTEVTSASTETAEITTAVTYETTAEATAETTAEITVTGETSVSTDYIPIPVTPPETSEPPVTSEVPVTSEPPTAVEPPVFDYETSNLGEYIMLGKYNGIEVRIQPWELITEEQLDVELEIFVDDLLEAAAIFEGECKKGDRVNVDFYGTIDGKPFNGGEGAGHILTLGKHEYILSIDDDIAGMSVGETKEIEAVFPVDYGTPAYNGKTAIFEITLNYIYPPLTDELVADYTDFESVSALRESLCEQSKKENMQMLEDAVLTKAMANSYFIKLPKEEVAARYENMVSINKLLAHMLQIPYEQYLMDSFGISADEAEVIFMESAKNEVSQRLLIYAIARDIGMDISNAAYESKLLSETGYDSIEEFISDTGMAEEQLEEGKYTYIRETVIGTMVSNANFVETLAN